MQKVMSIRVDEDEYQFVNQWAQKEKEDKTHVVRELLELGRVMLAVEQYTKGKASIGVAAKIAGLPLSELMDVFATFGIKSNVRYEDYTKGLKNARAAW